jgi:hypothetical protein
VKITPSVSSDKNVSSVTVKNIVPGQKLKVTVIEGGPSESQKARPSPTPSPKATVAKKPFTVTNNEPPKAVPSPSGSKASVNFNNLKPGQKIKVTVKTGGTTK